MRFLSVARRAARPASTLVAAAVLSSCTTDTLDVVNPDVINVGDVSNTLGAVAQRNGALQDFTIAFSGTQDGFIMSTGNMADEVTATDTFFDRLLPNERNMTDNLPNMDTYYLNLHKARAGATRAAITWAQLKPLSKDTLAELYAIRGYTESFFGEGYCSGVPFSEEDASGADVFGDPLTTTQMFTRSIASFDTSLTNAVSTNVKNLAAVGRARALLNLGRFADAATAVSAVPTTFKYQVFHTATTTRQENGIWRGTAVAGSRYTVANNEGVNGYNYLQTPADPRMPWTTSTRTGFDGTTRNMPTQTKYLQPTNATLADGIEARLIELEARLQGGTQADRDAVFAGLNNLRATGTTPAITPLAAAATTQAAAVDQLFRERAYWMWLTGHRLGDMRRLIRQYGRTANTVFPTGPVITRPGVNYGNDVNFIVPFDETANPKFKGCIDRNA